MKALRRLVATLLFVSLLTAFAGSHEHMIPFDERVSHNPKTFLKTAFGMIKDQVLATSRCIRLSRRFSNGNRRP